MGKLEDMKTWVTDYLERNDTKWEAKFNPVYFKKYWIVPEFSKFSLGDFSQNELYFGILTIEPDKTISETNTITPISQITINETLYPVQQLVKCEEPNNGIIIKEIALNETGFTNRLLSTTKNQDLTFISHYLNLRLLNIDFKYNVSFIGYKCKCKY